MSCDIVHANEWATPTENYFVSVGFGRDVVVLYQDKGSGPQKLRSIELPSNAICFDYAPKEPGLVVVGGGQGSIHTLNFHQQIYSSLKFEAKYRRPVNSVSINGSGLVGMGLDRARGEDSLLIWDLQAESQTPMLSTLANEAVSSLKFIPQRPTQLLAATYKSIRELDTRTNGKDSRLIPTKYSSSLRVHPADENIFLSLSESGTLALWDRRRIYSKSSDPEPGAAVSGVAEPLLVIPRIFSEARGKVARCVQLNPQRAGEFGVLNDGEVIRRWQTAVVVQDTATPVSALSSQVAGQHHGTNGSTGGSTSNGHGTESEENLGSWVIDRVVDVHLDHDKVVAFDYFPSAAKTDLVCIRQSGHVFRLPCKDPMRTLDFVPNNELVAANARHIYNVRAGAPPKPYPLRNRSHSDNLLDQIDDDEDIVQDGDDADSAKDDESVVSNSLMAYGDVLRNDITYIIGQRAEHGYGSNHEQNLQVLRESPNHVMPELLDAWKWLKFSHKQDQDGSAHTASVDIAFAGVAALWKGFEGFKGQRRFDEALTADEYNANIVRLAEKYSGKVYVAAQTQRSWDRQLCLRAAGWTFEIDELEEMLTDLEKKGQHEKAAGWAVFHGRVERAIQSLAASRNSQLRLMSTAVAGYLLYKDVPTNNAWREQCRRLASEMSVPYLRAIFAYISDGSWLDVLEEGSLPAVERLGIALRFLSDAELDRYLERVTSRAIADGDLEGIILLGQTPPLVDLLQSFVDRTGDVQTASLLVTFGSPRFFVDERISHWISAYHLLLNQRKLFTVRAVFDVSRNKLSKSRLKGITTVTPVPKQVFMRCLNCREILGAKKDTGKDFFSNNRCPNCNHPLPKCAICLMSLGPFSREEPPLIDKWPTFCMTCNHGYHTKHAREWFERHIVCPVPECQCSCGLNM